MKKYILSVVTSLVFSAVTFAASMTASVHEANADMLRPAAESLDVPISSGVAPVSKVSAANANTAPEASCTLTYGGISVTARSIFGARRACKKAAKAFL